MDGYSQQEIDDAINQTAAQAGMDPAHWRAIAQIESGLTPGSNYGKGTQYKGLFQIGTRGAQSEWATHGSGDVYNPLDNARAAATLAADNNARFQARFGRAPTPIETYMMHQQGFGFYSNGTMTNIAGNPYSKSMIASQETPASFERGWGNKLEDMATGKAYQGGQSVAGTIASASGATDPTRAGSRLSLTSGGAPSQDQEEQQPGQDLGSQFATVRDRIAQQEQANQPQPMNFQWMQTPQTMTPAMQRARMLAQAIFNRDLGVTPPQQPQGDGTS